MDRKTKKQRTEDRETERYIFLLSFKQKNVIAKLMKFIKKFKGNFY